MTFSWLNYTILLLLWLCCSMEEIQNGCEPPPRREFEEPINLPLNESYSHGDVIPFRCRPGYVRTGRIQFRCNNGNWEQDLPAVGCRKRSCGHPGDLDYGSFELINEDAFVFGAHVVYQCNEGYQMLSRRNYRDCLADGWTNSVPHCEIKKCFPVKAPENGTVIRAGLMDLDQDYEYLNVIYFKCIKDFKIQGSSEIYCTAQGNWSAPVPSCVETTCYPEPVHHARIIAPKAVYKNGDRIAFSCDRGYKHSWRADAICSENGWNTPLECKAILCLPPKIENYNFHPKQNLYKYEETIQIQCEVGYQIHERNSSCTENGWSPPPRCLKMPHTCKKIALLDGSFDERKNHFYLNEKTTYSCQNGATTQEGRKNGVIQCLAKGWRPEPKCISNTNAFTPDSGAYLPNPSALILVVILFNLLGNWILPHNLKASVG